VQPWSLVFDYAEYDLDRIIRHHKDACRGRSIPARMVKSITWQMLHGLKYLHDAKIMHRDLKPQNILIMGDGVEQGVVKIADFGLARDVRSPARPLSENGPVVTLWYRAPELLLAGLEYNTHHSSHSRYFAVVRAKHGSTDDSQCGGPCNHSDTPREMPPSMLRVTNRQSDTPREMPPSMLRVTKRVTPPGSGVATLVAGRQALHRGGGHLGRGRHPGVAVQVEPS
jgi:serine/threonine protein kinase